MHRPGEKCFEELISSNKKIDNKAVHNQPLFCNNSFLNSQLSQHACSLNALRAGSKNPDFLFPYAKSQEEKSMSENDQFSIGLTLNILSQSIKILKLVTRSVVDTRSFVKFDSYVLNTFSQIYKYNDIKILVAENQNQDQFREIFQSI